MKNTVHLVDKTAGIYQHIPLIGSSAAATDERSQACTSVRVLVISLPE